MKKIDSHCNHLTPMAIIIVVFIALQGCSVNRYISEHYLAASQKMPFIAQQPIAQKINFVYASGNIISGVSGFTSFYVATNLESEEELNRRGMQYIKQKYPGVKNKDFVDTSTLSEVLTFEKSNIAAPAYTAQARLDSGNSITGYQSASIQNIEMAKSFDSSIDMMNAGISLISGLKSWVRAMHEVNGYALMNWVIKNTGAIGPGAADGTVLNIDFIRVLKGESFNFASESEVIVSAYLERPGKKTIYSTQGIQFSVFSGDIPPADKINNMVEYDKNTTQLNQMPLLQTMKDISFGLVHATLANAAVEDIYRVLANEKK